MATDIIQEYLSGNLSDRDLEALQKGESVDSVMRRKNDNTGQFMKGLKSGVDQVQATVYGAKAAVGDMVGNQEWIDSGLEGYQRNMQEAQQNAGNVEGFTEIGDAGEFVDWAAHTLGQVLPSIGASVVGGGIGGVIAKQAVSSVAKKAAEKAMAAQVERLVASGVARTQAQNAAMRVGAEVEKQVLNRAAGVGAGVGAMGVSTGMETGSILGQIHDETGEVDSGTAFAHGVVGGALDALPIMRVLDKTGLGGTAREAIQKSLPGDVVTQMLAEGSTEGLQSLIEQHAVNWAKTDGESLLSTPDKIDWKQMLNEAAAGMLGGAATSIASHPFKADPQEIDAYDPLLDLQNRKSIVDERDKELVAVRKEYRQRMAEGGNADTVREYEDRLKTLTSSLQLARNDLEQFRQGQDADPYQSNEFRSVSDIASEHGWAPQSRPTQEAPQQAPARNYRTVADIINEQREQQGQAQAQREQEIQARAQGKQDQIDAQRRQQGPDITPRQGTGINRGQALDQAEPGLNPEQAEYFGSRSDAEREKAVLAKPDFQRTADDNIFLQGMKRQRDSEEASVLLRPNGKPFPSERTASLYQKSNKQELGQHQVVPVEGGFGLVLPTVTNSSVRPTDKTKPEADPIPEQPAATPAIDTRSDTRKATVSTPAGRDIDVEYTLVELDDLTASNDESGAINPSYPQNLQPRDRTRPASIDQINKIAVNLNPKLLGESHNTADGAPIISTAGVVESGNGRTLALRRAYGAKGESAAKYRAWLDEQGYNTKAMRKPVLVRKRTTELSDEELSAYTQESNQRTTLEMSATEQAASDGKQIDKIVTDYRGGDIASAGNRDFVRKFIQGVVGSADQGGMLDSDGMLSQTGKRRIEAALLSAAYGDADVVRDVFESADTDIKAIGGALLDAAGIWAQMRQQSQAGAVADGLDVTDNLMEAVGLIRKARASGRPLAELINTADMFSGDVASMTESFLRLFYRGESLNRARGRESVASDLLFYANKALATQPGEGLFGDAVTADQLIKATHEQRAAQENAGAGQNDLFAGPRPDESNLKPPSGEGRGPAAEGLDPEPAASDRQGEAEERLESRPENGQSEIDAAANEAATSPLNNLPEPTDKQKDAGNYKKGKIRFQGLDISIENPKGSVRSGTDPDGARWENTIHQHYGDIQRTNGADGDPVDVFVGDLEGSTHVFVIDQVNKDGSFDEHKVMLGFSDQDEAVSGYLKNYDKGWKVGPVTALSMDEFKSWLKDGDTTKPLTDIKTPAPSKSPSSNDQATVKQDDAGQSNDQQMKEAEPRPQEASDKKTTKGTHLADKAETKIDDFGEKLEGARKYTSTLREAVESDIDTKAVPLSKSFPQPDYEKLAASGVDPRALAFIAQGRAEIKSKPRSQGLLKQWAKSVDVARETAALLLSGKISIDKVLNDLGEKRGYLKHMPDVLALAKDILPGQIKDLGTIKLEQAHYSLFRGEKDVTKWQVTDTSKKGGFGGMGNQAHFDSKEEALAYIKARVSDVSETGKALAKFDVWSERGKKGFFVGKRVSARKYVELKSGFESSVEARKYITENNEALVEQLKNKKKTGQFRRAENNPRIGKDYRNGKNVTPEEFGTAFGFRGVQFGNWVENDKRQADLNNAYDGLMDLAELLNLPPKALSLNGQLGLAFGARGHGGPDPAAAHYERGGVVINLTKKQGAGSLAHEWWHALDHYFGEGENPDVVNTTEKGAEGYATPQTRNRHKRTMVDGKLTWQETTDADFNTRREMYDAFQAIMKAIKASDLPKRSAEQDKTRSKDYWGTDVEMSARSFERFVIDKLADNGNESDYLANVIDEEAWSRFAEEFGAYPYPTKDELKSIRKAFDAFFGTIKHKETDKGVALFSRVSKNAPVIETDGGPIGKSKTLKYMALRAKEFAKRSFAGRMVVNKQTGHEISISMAGVKHTIGGAQPDLLKSIAVIPDILEQGEYLGEKPDSKGNKAIVAHHYYGVKVRIDGVVRDVVADVREMADGKRYYDHSFERKTGPKSTEPSNARNSSPAEANDSASTDSIASDPAGDRLLSVPLDVDADAATAGDSRAITTHDANEIVSRIVAGWNGSRRKDFVVIDSFAGLPDDIKQQAQEQGAEGEVHGVFHKGKVFLVADRMQSEQDVERTLFHEALGHLGLAKLFGPEIRAQMGRLYLAIGGSKGLLTLAKKHNIDLTEYAKGLTSKDKDGMGELDMLREQTTRNAILMEELLTHIAQDSKPNLKRQALELIGAIRAWLRKRGFIKLSEVSESELFALLKQARQQVESGKPGGPSGGGTRFVAEASIKSNTTAMFSRASNPYSVPDHIKAIEDRNVVKADIDKTFAQRLKEWFKSHIDTNWTSIKQGMIDSFASIDALERGKFGDLQDASESAYKAALRTKNLNSIMGAVMNKGTLILRNGGLEMKAGTKGLLELFAPIADRDLTRTWETWAAAKRAQRLMTEGKERNFSDADIDGILSWVDSNHDIKQLFEQAHRDYQQFNRDMLDLGEAAGLIDPDLRALWERDDYIPFHRVSELGDEQEATGPRNSKGLSGQKSGVQKLEGGAEKIMPLEAIVRNTTALIDASLKNLAMQRVVELADGTAMEKISHAPMPLEEVRERLEQAGIDTDGMTEADLKGWRGPIDRHDKKDGTVSVTIGGKVSRYRVNDPVLMRAITSMGPTTVEGVMKLFRFSKRLLTASITSDPGFATVNLLRDSLSTWVTVDAKTTPLLSAIQGVNKSLRDDDSQWAIMAAGAGGGGYYDSSPDDTRKHLSDLTRRKGLAGVGSQLKDAWTAYQKILSAGENANRIAVYDSVIKEGGTRAEAAHQAQDVLNFNKHGDYKSMRVLIEMVPFMNARIQGLDRLARGAKENPKAFAMKGAIITAATLALLAQNWDEDEYWDLPEHERDTYYHFFIDGEHYRLPKAFEVSALFSTIPERAFEQMRQDATSKEFAGAMLRMIVDTFAMDPTPQLVKPMIEIAKNENSFTGSPIVSKGLQYVRPDAQYNPYTSETMRLVAESMPDWMPEWARSPVRLQHAFKGYLGTLGSYSLMMSDFGVRELGDMPLDPTNRYRDIPVVQRFVRDGVGGTKHSNRLYSMMQEANELQAAIKKYQEEGQAKKAQELKITGMEKLRARSALNKAARRLSQISSRTKRIYDNRRMTAEQKRSAIDELTRQRNQITHDVSERYWQLF